MAESVPPPPPPVARAPIGARTPEHHAQPIRQVAGEVNNTVKVGPLAAQRIENNIPPAGAAGTPGDRAKVVVEATSIVVQPPQEGGGANTPTNPNKSTNREAAPATSLETGRKEPPPFTDIHYWFTEPLQAKHDAATVKRAFETFDQMFPEAGQKWAEASSLPLAALPGFLTQEDHHAWTRFMHDHPEEARIMINYRRPANKISNGERAKGETVTASPGHTQEAQAQRMKQRGVKDGVGELQANVTEDPRYQKMLAEERQLQEERGIEDRVHLNIIQSFVRAAKEDPEWAAREALTNPYMRGVIQSVEEGKTGMRDVLLSAYKEMARVDGETAAYAAEKYPLMRVAIEAVRSEPPVTEGALPPTGVELTGEEKRQQDALDHVKFTALIVSSLMQAAKDYPAWAQKEATSNPYMRGVMKSMRDGNESLLDAIHAALEELAAMRPEDAEALARTNPLMQAVLEQQKRNSQSTTSHMAA